MKWRWSWELSWSLAIVNLKNIKVPHCQNIPDDTVPVTAYLKELLKLATKNRPLLIFLDSVDELTGSQDANKMSWLPLKIPPHCKIVVSCTYEEGKPALMQVSR